MDERLLIKNCMRKKPEAQRQLYEKYETMWFMICLRYANDRSEAEDMLQEGLISIFNHLKKFDDRKAAFSTWSSKVMVNAALQYLRKWNRLRFNDELTSESPLVDTEYSVIEKIGAQEITNLVQSLPDGYRSVFNLYVIEGYKHFEIAEMLGISESTSKSQLRKAKSALRNKLEVILQYK